MDELVIADGAKELIFAPRMPTVCSEIRALNDTVPELSLMLFEEVRVLLEGVMLKEIVQLKRVAWREHIE